MEIWFYCSSIPGYHIITDSSIYVTKSAYIFCHDNFIKIQVGAKWNFHSIWILMKKSLVRGVTVTASRSIALHKTAVELI